MRTLLFTAFKHFATHLDSDEVSTVVPLVDPAISALAQHLPELQPDEGRALDCRRDGCSSFDADSHKVAVAPGIADWPRLHLAIALCDELSGCRPACN